jgi:hypothetical protein
MKKTEFKQKYYQFRDAKNYAEKSLIALKKRVYCVGDNFKICLHDITTGNAYGYDWDLQFCVPAQLLTAEQSKNANPVFSHPPLLKINFENIFVDDATKRGTTACCHGIKKEALENFITQARELIK